MKLLQFVIIAAPLLAATACGWRDTALSDADRAAIRVAAQKYVEADGKRDVEAMIQLIGENAVYMPANSQPIVGREAIRTLFVQHPWDKIEEAAAEIEGRLDFAIVRGSYNATIQGKPSAGYYIEVWQKQTDGAWKITRKVWNTDRQ